MATGGNAPASGLTVGLPPDQAYRALNNRRTELDIQILSLPGSDPARDELWQSMQLLMDEIRQVVAALAAVKPASVTELQRKAAVLAELLTVDPNDQIIPDAERTALALSLMSDIADLPSI